MLYVQLGDRIRLLTMHCNPAPIPTGETGTVVGVVHHTSGQVSWRQILVKWDSGRTFMLDSPPATFELISPQTAAAVESAPRPTDNNPH